MLQKLRLGTGGNNLNQQWVRSTTVAYGWDFFSEGSLARALQPCLLPVRAPVPGGLLPVKNGYASVTTCVLPTRLWRGGSAGHRDSVG